MTDQYLLIDSGSQCTAFPPDPGDREVEDTCLRAVNGTRIKCYGFKNIQIKIGRKTYDFRAIKADVESPVLGWDFMRKHRLDMVWNEWGDLCLVDKKANISKVLEYKSLPHSRSSAHRNLALITAKPGRSGAPQAQNLLFQVAAMEALCDPAQESIELLPDSPYKHLLAKYPDLLKLSFNEEVPKNKISHRINTGEATPVKSKCRRLVPGSDKEKKAKAAFDELIRFGIVERVNPEDPNTWSSPLHFVDKGDNTFRVVGDYRGLNSRTVPDHYPLPHVRDYSSVPNKRSAPNKNSAIIS